MLDLIFRERYHCAHTVPGHFKLSMRHVAQSRVNSLSVTSLISPPSLRAQLNVLSERGLLSRETLNFECANARRQNIKYTSVTTAHIRCDSRSFFYECRFREKELGELTMSTLQVELRFYARIKTFYVHVNKFNSIDFSHFAFNKKCNRVLYERMTYLFFKGHERIILILTFVGRIRFLLLKISS